MPKKIRELKGELRRAGWTLMAGGGKGSHTKWEHTAVDRNVTLSGADGNDADHYQVRDVARAIRETTQG